MSEPRMRTGSGAPSFCWHCFKQLQRAPGRGQGLFFFNLVRDRDGQQHRVHGFPCTKQAVADGATLIPVEAN